MSKQITIFMISLYTIVGVIFIFTDLLMEQINQHRELWGGLFLAYALFRATMLYRQSKKEQNENREL